MSKIEEDFDRISSTNMAHWYAEELSRIFYGESPKKFLVRKQIESLRRNGLIELKTSPRKHCMLTDFAKKVLGLESIG